MRRCRVLLMDDEPSLRGEVLAALDPIRFRTVVAASAVMAARLLDRTPFDLVICTRLHTLATFRALTIGMREIPTLVLSNASAHRPWTMTSGVRFLRTPGVLTELRSLVAELAQGFLLAPG